MRESSVESKLVRLAKQLNGRAIKMQRTGRRGETDRLLVLPAGVNIWVEVKRPNERPRESQRRVHKWLRQRGHTVIVCDGTNWPEIFTYLRGVVILAKRLA